jgi:transposase
MLTNISSHPQGGAGVRQRIRRVCRVTGSLSCLRRPSAGLSLLTTLAYAMRGHMTHGAHKACAAFVGSDWADTQHDVCLQAAGAEKREFCMLAHTPEAIDAWGSPLRTRFHGSPMAICLERNQGPLGSAWRQYAFLVLCPLKPMTLARSRKAFTPSRAKDAPTDAELPLALLLTHRHKLQPLQPPSPAMRALAQLVAQRRRVVGDTVRLPNRLPRTLKHSLPHVLHCFQDKDPLIFWDVLRRWPPLNAAQLARRSTLATFVRDHPVRSTDVIAKRIRALQAATPLPTAEGGIAPQALLVQTLGSQLRVPWHAIENCDTAIAQRAQSPPDCALCQALPGAGPVFAARLLVAFGEQRARYASAAELQPYAGIAPVTARSGTQCWVHWRLQCPPFLRQTLVEGAAESIRHSFWARVSYQQQRDKGKAHQAAVRTLAFKWLRILSRCWQERIPYAEATSLQALNRRGSSLIHNLAKAS